MMLVFVQSACAAGIKQNEITEFFNSLDEIIKNKNYKGLVKSLTKDFSYRVAFPEGNSHKEEFLWYNEYLNEAKIFFESDATTKSYKTTILDSKRFQEGVIVETSVKSVVEYETYEDDCVISSRVYLLKSNNQIQMYKFIGLANCISLEKKQTKPTN